MNIAKDVHKSVKPTQHFLQPAQNYLNTNPTKQNQNSTKPTTTKPQYLARTAIQNQNHNQR